MIGSARHHCRLAREFEESLNWFSLAASHFEGSASCTAGTSMIFGACSFDASGLARLAVEGGGGSTLVRRPFTPYLLPLSVVYGVPAGGGRSLMTGFPLASCQRYRSAAIALLLPAHTKTPSAHVVASRLDQRCALMCITTPKGGAG